MLGSTALMALMANRTVEAAIAVLAPWPIATAVAIVVVAFLVSVFVFQWPKWYARRRDAERQAIADEVEAQEDLGQADLRASLEHTNHIIERSKERLAREEASYQAIIDKYLNFEDDPFYKQFKAACEASPDGMATITFRAEGDPEPIPLTKDMEVQPEGNPERKDLADDAPNPRRRAPAARKPSKQRKLKPAHKPASGKRRRPRRS